MTSSDDLFLRVARVVRSTFNVGEDEPIVPETTSADIDGWDSLAHSILVMGIEDEFGIDLPLDRAFDLPNVGALAGLVEETLPGSRSA